MHFERVPRFRRKFMLFAIVGRLSSITELAALIDDSEEFPWKSYCRLDTGDHVFAVQRLGSIRSASALTSSLNRQ
jgi:hypothetical protein